MAKRKRSFDREFKLSAIAQLAGAESLAGIAEGLGIRRELLHRWRRKYETLGADGLRPLGRPSAASRPVVGPGGDQAADDLTAARERIAALERKVGEQQLDLDFFRAALRQVRERRQKSVVSGATASTR